MAVCDGYACSVLRRHRHAVANFSPAAVATATPLVGKSAEAHWLSPKIPNTDAISGLGLLVARVVRMLLIGNKYSVGNTTAACGIVLKGQSRRILMLFICM